MRFQSQVPRTIMHLTSVILTFLASASAARCQGPANAHPAEAVRRNSRRFIMIPGLLYQIRSGTRPTGSRIRRDSPMRSRLFAGLSLVRPARLSIDAVVGRYFEERGGRVGALDAHQPIGDLADARIASPA